MSDTRKVFDPFLNKEVEVSARLVNRLRGRYAVGPTLANGEPEFGWRQFEVPPIQEEAAGVIEALETTIEELKKQVYIPGSWYCPKCKFVLVQRTFNVPSGTVSVRDTPGDKCPNCNSPLWRCTWKQDSDEMHERAIEQMKRAEAAENLLESEKSFRERDKEEIKQLRVAIETLTNNTDNGALCLEINDLIARLGEAASEIGGLRRELESLKNGS